MLLGELLGAVGTLCVGWMGTRMSVRTLAVWELVLAGGYGAGYGVGCWVWCWAQSMGFA